MNTKSLSNLYGQLTPEERHPLILSAILRDDHVESERLKNAAPIAHYCVANYHGHLEGFHNAFLLHVIDCLDMIAWTFRFDQQLTDLLADPEPDETEIEWFYNAIRIYSLALVNRCEAWRQFGTARGINAQAYLRLIPASQTIEQAEAIATEIACTIQESDDWLKKERGEGVKAKGLQSYLDEMNTVCGLFVAHWQ